MRRLSLASLFLLGSFCLPALAQDTIPEYPILPWKPDPEKDEFAMSLASAMIAWNDSLGLINSKYVEFQDHRVYLFVLMPEYEFYDPFVDVPQGTLLVSKKAPKKGFQHWYIPLSPLPSPFRRNFDRSTLFYSNDVLYLKLYTGAYNDFIDQGGVGFYALGDSARYVGGISLHNRDDASGTAEIRLYNGRLLPFEKSAEGAHITLMRQRFSEYPIEYLLTPATLKLIKNHEPEFHMTLEEAQTELNSIFDHYYSPLVKERAISPEGRKRRAEDFFWRFELLATKRADFAPAHYNSACMLAILGNQEQALAFLKTAIELDPSYIQKAQSDTDLSSLRETPAFKALIEP